MNEKYFVYLTLACPKPGFKSNRELVGRDQETPSETAQEAFQPRPARSEDAKDMEGDPEFDDRKIGRFDVRSGKCCDYG